MANWEPLPQIMQRGNSETRDGFRSNEGRSRGMRRPKPGCSKYPQAHLSGVEKNKKNASKLTGIIQPEPPTSVLVMLSGISVHYKLERYSQINNNSILGGGFIAECRIDEQIFRGTGHFRQMAKNNCAEKAVQYLVAKKSAENETPWDSLASLGLFKLFNEWKNVGFVIPNKFVDKTTVKEEFSDSVSSSNSETNSTQGSGNSNDDETSLNIKKEIIEQGSSPNLPETPNPEVGNNREMNFQIKQEPNSPEAPIDIRKTPEAMIKANPLKYLEHLSGPIQYQDVRHHGNDNENKMFIRSATVDGKTFQGKPEKGKKAARRSCAIEGLRVLHNIIYP